ncbi:MAG: carboxylesterase family protein [Acidaminococcus sp.]|nr:carboxylesterase family protein [Acidaminococcus sp.]
MSRFGGDPDNVTLFGQSGGGSKILEACSRKPSCKVGHRTRQEFVLPRQPSAEK